MPFRDSVFLLQHLVVKDFKIRYRNMSLGVLWSLLNPLMMMGVLTLVFSRFFPSPSIRSFPVFVLCGLVPFNFFALAWSSGMTSIVDNATLVRRVPVNRVLLPAASVLANCIHMLIQTGLLLAFVLAYGFEVNRYWLLVPIYWLFEILFVLGLVLISTALDVYVRDFRYVVDSMIRALFWLVPIFYSIDIVPRAWQGIYELNPIASLTLALRGILIDGSPPRAGLLVKLIGSSLLMLLCGWTAFTKMERRFYERL